MTKIIEHDIFTGETVLREMTKDELAQQEIDRTNAEKLKTQDAAFDAAKIAAQAKLQALGLTANDLKALGLGGN